MYLVKMRIVEGIGQEKEIRNVEFHKVGLNIVVDDSSNDSDFNGRGNNVGKTTFLKLVDICLGAKDKRYIWTDHDTGSETTTLKNYIKDNKVFVELEVEDERRNHKFKVELFERGKRYIDNTPYSQDNYNEKLNKIFFNIEKPPSFRQLIGKFVRIKQKEDTNTFLKYLNQNTTNAQYKNIYDFLFKLSSQEESKRKLNLYTEIEEIKKDISQIIRLHKFSNIDDLNERIRIVKTVVKDLESKINSMVSIKEFQKNLEGITDVRNKINELNDSIEDNSFKKTKIESILQKEKLHQDTIDDAVLREFYDDVEVYLGKISKEFTELIEFNKSIKKNKINYYGNRIKKIDSSLNEMIKLREEIINKNKNIITLINEDNYSEFEKSHKELIKQSEILGELSRVHKIYTDLNVDLVKKEVNYNAIQTNSESFDNLSKFNEYLTKFSHEIFGQRLYLSRSNPFPLKLSNVDDGLGTGYRKTITLLLDIAFVSFVNELKLGFPKFFIHDVLETVDEHNLNKIVDIINENGSQFVFAILNEKINSYSFIDENDIILRLSEENKLFKI